MAWTEAQLNALKDAYARGERSVTFGDRTTTYRSESEMREQIATISAELARAAQPARPRQYAGYSTKGL